MRQVGKTTLLQQLYPLVPSKNKVFLDFENPLERKLFETLDFDQVLDNLASRGITQKERAYIFIDEIQNLPIISKVAKYLIDHYETKFFLTGSSSYYIKNLFPESMAGRKLISELFPLTFAEFLVFKGVKRYRPTSKNEFQNIELKPLYKEYMTYGGFPAVVLEPNLEMKRKLLEGVFQTYFEKDVKTLADLVDRSRLRDLILLLVPRIGGRVEVEKIATELETTRATVYSYLEFLEATYFLTLLPRYSKSIDRSRAGRRKVYFADTGLAGVLGHLSEGQMLENSVFQALRPDHKLAFYTKENKEIDFIIDTKIAAEVKTTASRRDIFELKKRSQSLGIKKNQIISLNWSSEKEVVLATGL
jgi:predicted AAA+ superfamily ATPase